MLAIRKAFPPKPWRLVVWAVLGALLLAPLAAMQITPQVAWTPGDFAAAAVLLGMAGLMFEVVTRSLLRTTLKLALLALGFVVLVLVWAQGAVGIF